MVGFGVLFLYVCVTASARGAGGALAAGSSGAGSLGSSAYGAQGGGAFAQPPRVIVVRASPYGNGFPPPQFARRYNQGRTPYGYRFSPNYGFF